jgi:hypothetical protein
MVIETALVALLAPVLKGLLGDATDALEDAGRRGSAEAVAAARKVWKRLGPSVEGRPAAVEAAQDVAARPDDERARGALELQLEKILAAEPALARELEQLVAEARRSAGDVIFEGPVRADRGGVVAGRVEGGIRTGWREGDDR